MQGAAWIALFRRIPADYHDSLALTLTTGSEIVVQSIFRLEEEFIILRGRMAGSTDAPRVVMLPYHQIVNVSFQKVMLEPEVQSIFGELIDSIAQADTRANAAEATKATPTTPAPVEEPTPRPSGSSPAGAGYEGRGRTAGPAEKHKVKQPLPSKSILLARLRARLAEQEK